MRPSPNATQITARQHRMIARSPGHYSRIGRACRAPDPSLPRANHAPRRLGAAQPRGSSCTRARLVVNCRMGHPWPPISGRGGGNNHRECQEKSAVWRESESHRGLFFGPSCKNSRPGRWRPDEYIIRPPRNTKPRPVSPHGALPRRGCTGP